MSMSRLFHLPDLCILSIFAHIPLVEVICTIGGVCKNWSKLQKDELKRRRTIGFYQDMSDEQWYYDQKRNPFGSDLIEHVRRDDGLPWERVQSHNQIMHNALQVPGDVLTQGFTSQIVQMLPRITHLSMEQCISRFSVSSAVGQMIRLIEHHAKGLISLKINFLYYYADKPTERKLNNLECNVLALFDCINHLKSLRHLMLNVKNRDMMKIGPKLRLPIMSRLNTFCTVEHEMPIYVWTQYVNEGNVQINCDRECSLERLLPIAPAFSTKFVRVLVENNLTIHDYDRTRQFCDRFSSLASLCLTIESMPMTMLARCLSQLTQLIHLKLKFISWKSPVPQNEPTPPLTIAQVLSVCLLTLNIHTKSHHDTERLHISEIFPNLQVLDLSHFITKCSECALSCVQSIDQKEPKYRAKFENCMRLARQPFRRCAKLHHQNLFEFCQNSCSLTTQPVTVKPSHDDLHLVTNRGQHSRSPHVR